MHGRTWYLNLVSPVADTRGIEEAEALALAAVASLESSDFPINREHLLASPEIERLSDLLRKYGRPALSRFQIRECR